MALQIRRAHRFFPSSQDLIALRTSNRASKEKVPDTFSALHSMGCLPYRIPLLCILLIVFLGGCSHKDYWLVYEPQPSGSIPEFGYAGYKVFEGADAKKSEAKKKEKLEECRLMI